MMRCFYAGSFDPPTLGHIDLIRRASRLFDEVVVGVMINPDKKGMFPVPERVDMLREETEDLPNVRVVADSGLTVDMARRSGCQVLLRGVRSAQDVALEEQLSGANRHVSGLETLILFTAPEYGYITSSIVRDLIRHGASVEGMVGESVKKRLTANEKTTPDNRKE